MKSLAISLEENKFPVENNRWRFTQSRLEYLAQKVHHAISIFQGEWFFNRDIGIPYIPGENDNGLVHRRLIESRLQATIVGVEGIARLVQFKTSLDKAKRELAVNFTAQIDTGEIYSDRVTI
jgi:hypothetical protein